MDKAASSEYDSVSSVLSDDTCLLPPSVKKTMNKQPSRHWRRGILKCYRGKSGTEVCHHQTSHPSLPPPGYTSRSPWRHPTLTPGSLLGEYHREAQYNDEGDEDLAGEGKKAFFATENSATAGQRPKYANASARAARLHGGGSKRHHG